MKTAPLLLAIALLAVASASAQQKTSAADKPAQLAPAPAPGGADILIPENLPQNPKPQGSAIPQPSSMPPSSVSRPRSTATKSATEPKPNQTQAAEAEIKQRIQYRIAKNKAVRDPAVQAAWEDAAKARTEVEKREALQRYYNLLNARIRKIDGSLSKVTIERETRATGRLRQNRIDPTEPLDPTDRTNRERRD